MLPKFQKPDSCKPCQLYDLGKGYAPASGPRGRLTFIGESLGYNEAIAGMPFVGAAGGMFHTILTRAEINRDYVRVDNCVRCQPVGDWLDGAPWQASALTNCRQYLQTTLDEVPDNGVVVTLGAIALKQVLDLWGLKKITVNNFHGTVHRDPTNRFWVVPTFHPSYLQRGAINLLDVVRFDLTVARTLAQSGTYARRPVRLMLDPPVESFRAWADAYLHAIGNDPWAVPLSVDIETPDKSGGRDENELTPDDTSTQIDRVNFSDDPDFGLTVPYVGAYIPIIDSVLRAHGVKYMWFKSYDEPRLRLAGHAIGGDILDLMWAAHHLHSDYPLGLGFWAPFASDYGAWKHLASIDGKDTEYAGVDGLQERRLGDWLLSELQRAGLWDAFYRHSHLREQYVLRPAYEVGIGTDIKRLDAFHDKLQIVAADKLTAINSLSVAGTLRPKEGYREKPKGDPCPDCEGIGYFSATAATDDQDRPGCARCDATGFLAPAPPASVIGKAGAKGDTAKQEYIEGGISLVQRDITLPIRVCHSCGKSSGIGPKHNCLQRKRRKGDPALVEGTLPSEAPQPDIRTEQKTESRWFWQLPFNPDAPQQILKYIKDTGQQPGRAKKTKKSTTDKETLRRLAKSTGDPIYQLLLDYKAVKKVDSTYALGAKKRIWSDGRLHPVPTQRPSTHRDSYVSPNIQNCLAAGTLIEVVRDCSAFPKGIPIEDVQVGDLAYTFDDQLRLTLRRVTWVGQTGTRRVMRVYWRSAAKRPEGHVDLTPDHRVRLTSGDYIEAGQLAIGDRVLSLARVASGRYEYLYPTGQRAFRDHRFIWKEVFGTDDPHVHHKNENGHDNRLLNLQGLTVGEHFRHHNTGAGNPKWRDDLTATDPKTRRRDAMRIRRARKKINNHRVTRIELLEHAVPVYDLTVEDTHNFIAGELCVHNCVTDRGGKESLAAGFRACIVAAQTPDELPKWVSPENRAPAIFNGCRLLEVDYSGIEAVETGWFCGDPNYIRLATLGVHAFLTSHYIGKPASLAWSDADLAMYFADIKKHYPVEYDKAKRCVHGNNYGLTIFGMVQNFPEVFANLKEAQEIQDLYYDIAPTLPAFHQMVREAAYDRHYLGGPYVDDFTLLTTSCQHHPFSYRHDFHGVLSFRPLNESDYRKRVWWNKKRGKPSLSGIRLINNRPFQEVMGPDANRVIAMYPQGTSAGVLKEVELRLFHPESSTYIGETFFGRTPLRAPIHDSLLLEIPNRLWDYVVTVVVGQFRQPIYTQPCPAEWNIGSHLRVNIDAKAGKDWQDMERIQLPDMAPATAIEPMILPVEQDELDDDQDLGTRMVM